MFTYTFQIDKQDGNGLQTLTPAPFVGFSSVHELNEALDSGYMQILNTSMEIFPIMSYLRFTITQNDYSVIREFYIGKDDVVQKGKSSTSNGPFEHNIELIELTKKLEKKLGETICFTQPVVAGEKYYYLTDCIDRLLRIIPLGEDTEASWSYPDVNRTTDDNAYYDLPIPRNRVIAGMSTDLRTALNGIVSPQFVFQNLTLRELFDGILKYVNAISRVDTASNGTIRSLLGANFYNMLVNLISGTDYDTFKRDLTIETYATNTESFVQNVVNAGENNTSSIVYPSDNSYDILKSNISEYNVDDSNCGILTQYPIYDVEDIIFKVNIKYTINDGIIVRLEDVPISLNWRIFESEIYNNFADYNNNTPEEIYYDFSKNNTIYYTKNSNFINCSMSYKNFIFASPSLNNAIFLSVIKYLKENTNITTFYNLFTYISDLVNPDIEHYVADAEEVSIVGESVTITASSIPTISPLQYQNLQYRIKYTSQTNSRVTTQRENIDEIFLNTTNMSNQQERIISFENFTNSLWSQAQRVGACSCERTFRHYALQDLLNVGDYTENREIITTAEYIYFNNFILGKYVFSKDYNRLNEFIGLNAQIRQYQMPSDNQSYERLCKIENFVELDTTEQSIDSSTASYLTRNGIICFMATLFPNFAIYNLYSKINNAIYTTNDTDVTGYWSSLAENTNDYTNLLLESVCNGGGNAIVVDFGFQDNISAMPYRKLVSNDFIGVDKYIKQPVSYCKPSGDYIGFLRSFSAKLVFQGYNVTSNILPLCSAPADNNVYVSIPNMMVLKDPSEILRVNYQLSIVSNNSDIIIGRYLSSKNRLIYNVNTEETDANAQYLYVFVSNDEYSNYDNLRVKNTSGITPTLLSDAVEYGIVTDPPYLRFNESFIQGLSSNAKTIIIANESGTEMYLAIRTSSTVIQDRQPLYFNFLKNRSKIKYTY